MTWASSVELPLAAAWAARAEAAVHLSAGDPHRAADRALLSVEAAEAVGAPIEAALARTLAGRALAQAGLGDRAVEELQRAAAELDTCGALRYRDYAEHELRVLGRRIHRRSRPGRAGVPGIESLTEREFQVARLVVDRRTNAEIARRAVPQPKDDRDPPAQHLPQDQRLVASRTGPSRRTVRASQPEPSGRRITVNAEFSRPRSMRSTCDSAQEERLP